MDRKLLKIAITPTELFQDEALWIKTILEAGWDYVHLRHPGATLRDVKAVIERIPPKLHSKLRLHGHFELLNEFNLGGIHLNSRCPEAPAMYRGAISRTCHTIEEIETYSARHDYLTLSPIFPSISKPGYSGTFTESLLSTLPEGKVIALGGVTPRRLDAIAGLPFKGYAVLGYLFSSQSLDELKSRLKQFSSNEN
ncbi:MAG: thiamine phosphate synthase [Muribaculum sp.]|nr:thiamine phosphate synthase [Muribaculum sp.]